MATAGPNAPGTMADDSAVGAGVWATVDNAKVNDSSYSTNGSGAPATHYLKATAFGFAIPSGATINGIEVGITRKASINAKFEYANDNIVKLVKGGTVSGDSKASTTKWPTSDGTVTYGTTSDLWGTTWADTDINASNFGVVLSANTVTATASVNYISVTITYTEGGGGGGPVKQMMHTVRMRA